MAEWTDVAGLNYANPKLREYMIGMLKYWVTEFDVDGFRCDVAYMVPTDFWEQARVELEKIKPDIMMLAEAEQAGTAREGVRHRLLLAPARHVEQSHARRRARIELEDAPGRKAAVKFPQGAVHLRISDNHDEARAVARFGIRGALAAQVFMLTLDGVPLLYNGMEVGDATESGDPALFEKMPIFWQPKERPPLRDIYRDLIKLRKQYARVPQRPRDLVAQFRRARTSSASCGWMSKDEFVILINLSNRPMVGCGGSDERGGVQAREDLRHGRKPRATAFRCSSLNGFEWRIYHRAVKK